MTKKHIFYIDGIRHEIGEAISSQESFYIDQDETGEPIQTHKSPRLKKITKGISSHCFVTEKPIGPENLPHQGERKIVGRNISFEIDSVLLEAWAFLEEKGWANGGKISNYVLQAVHERYGDEYIIWSTQTYGEDWEWAILECASTFLTDLYSDLWYAANIEAIAVLARDFTKAGYLSCEWRIKRVHEADMLRGRESAAAAAEAGARLAEKTLKKSFAILEKMRFYQDKGHSISRSAELTFQAGLGSSASANRKIWYRQEEHAAAVVKRLFPPSPWF